METCYPNPCQYGGKCVASGNFRRCQCTGHYTGRLVSDMSISNYTTFIFSGEVDLIQTDFLIQCRFCGLTMCEIEPCFFGKCELTPNNFKVNQTFAVFVQWAIVSGWRKNDFWIRKKKTQTLFIYYIHTTACFQCHCQTGYIGRTCDQKQRPCANNPCESRGECFEKNGKFHCRYVMWCVGTVAIEASIPFYPRASCVLSILSPSVE